MKPIVDGLEQTYGEQLVFKRINAIEGNGPAIMRDYRIPGHPTTLIFDSEGQEVQRFIGPQPVEAIEDIILTIVKE
ncbi:MAG: thioredoxin family protein [Anaerolineae bacterium]|nr:thioredoxin family protein [Anaerolineae bacterium]